MEEVKCPTCAGTSFVRVRRIVLREVGLRVPDLDAAEEKHLSYGIPLTPRKRWQCIACRTIVATNVGGGFSLELFQQAKLRTEVVKPEDLDNLRHMLGVSDKHPRGYRNYFVAGGADLDSMKRLVAVGWAVENMSYVTGSGICYNATLDGAKALGLKELP